MHHKRKRPKNRRAGCLLCKPWKMNGWGNRQDCFGNKPTQLPKEDITERLDEYYEANGTDQSVPLHRAQPFGEEVPQEDGEAESSPS